MKKILLVIILAVIFSGVAFADHPENQLGIGVMGGYYSTFSGGFGGSAGFGLSLKVPSVPIFWGIYVPSFNPLYLGVSGDKYLYEGDLVSDINLHWFLGLGGWFNIGFSDPFYFVVGARLPVGLSWHVIDMLEVFLNVAPNLGLRLTQGAGLVGGIPFELGIRLWLK
jgi:hypothetical protein